MSQNLLLPEKRAQFSEQEANGLSNSLNFVSDSMIRFTGYVSFHILKIKLKTIPTGEDMNFISLRSKLIAAFAVFVLLPILLASIYAYRGFEGILRKQIEDSADELMHQININLERKLQTMMNAASSMVLDDSVQTVLVNPPSTEREKLDAAGIMDKKILELSTAIVSSDMYYTLADNYGNLYTNWGRTEDSYQQIISSNWYRKALLEDGYMIWELNHPSFAHPFRQQLITVSLVVRDSQFKKIGVLAVSEGTSEYLDIISQGESSLTSYGLLVGPDGSLLSSNPEQALPVYNELKEEVFASQMTKSLQVNGEELVVSSYLQPLTGWRFIQIVPHKHLYKATDTIRDAFFLILWISTAVFIGIIIFFSSMLTRPLRKLRMLMKQVETGNLNVSCDIRTRDELGLLGRSFDKMLDRLRNHIENEMVLQRHKEQAKLEALQAQINPHFLHNTLNTIRWMSIMAGTKPITEMLVSLGHLLDMSIHRGQESITLDKELENVRYFITIQKYRFGDHVQVTEEIAADTLAAYVPKLSLQPLVENVYRHASFTKGEGRMKICSRVTPQGELLLEVVDNGLEVNKDLLQGIMRQISQEQKSSFSGIGLRNVHERIRMLFGKSYGLRLERNEEEGRTRVSLILPFRVQEGED